MNIFILYLWKDFKNNIKKKFRHNTKCIRGTGGGPNKQYVLSSLEEEIVALLDLKTCESGMNIRIFGLEDDIQVEEFIEDNRIDTGTSSRSHEEDHDNLIWQDLSGDKQTEEFEIIENAPHASAPSS